MCSAPSQTGVRAANSATGGKTAAAVSQTIRSGKPIKEACGTGFFLLSNWSQWISGLAYAGFLTCYQRQVAYSLTQSINLSTGKLFS